ncbi:30S ribosome-binding factor RbfA [Phormidium tenue]|uniref:Ribosome-binding factor A n=1 Tax=Phormidium tenue NIES-30 TaxID=549789 RepID=A0A1U7J5F3_9CYAN|nr:30S ribosome-binding factor RbfA [Phormidium tenue]MBD2232724.1 30S ribosome-binding factor RbfA [Phormidium tenue FACHB-1052]OKH47840.1 ribosome-binding factor A [Phormidium tenue NIES-30]
MPNNRRVERVASLIKREISQMMMLDIKDDRVGAGMVSVTDVDVSGDLQHAKVFVSIYGTPEAKAETMEGLHAATGFVRSELGQRLRLRRTPEIIFKEDVGMERGTNVLNLINQLSRERAEKGITDEFDEDPTAPSAAQEEE